MEQAQGMRRCLRRQLPPRRPALTAASIIGGGENERVSQKTQTRASQIPCAADAGRHFVFRIFNQMRAEGSMLRHVFQLPSVPRREDARDASMLQRVRAILGHPRYVSPFATSPNYAGVSMLNGLSQYYEKVYSGSLLGHLVLG
jgi:hypothetical protein